MATHGEMQWHAVDDHAAHVEDWLIHEYQRELAEERVRNEYADMARRRWRHVK